MLILQLRDPNVRLFLERYLKTATASAAVAAATAAARIQVHHRAGGRVLAARRLQHTDGRVAAVQIIRHRCDVRQRGATGVGMYVRTAAGGCGGRLLLLLLLLTVVVLLTDWCAAVGAAVHDR